MEYFFDIAMCIAGIGFALAGSVYALTMIKDLILDITYTIKSHKKRNRKKRK